MSGPDPSPRLSTIPRERSRPSATASDRLKGRLRLLVVRHRLGRWATAGGAALLAAWTLTSAIADAESARAGWGEAVDVVVTRAALATGDVVTAGMVGIHSIPARVVPTNAVSALPLGARLTANVGPGEILVEHRLTRRSGSAASVALPDGTRGVKLDREEVFGDVIGRLCYEAMQQKDRRFRCLARFAIGDVDAVDLFRAIVNRLGRPDRIRTGRRKRLRQQTGGAKAPCKDGYNKSN